MKTLQPQKENHRERIKQKIFGIVYSYEEEIDRVIFLLILIFAVIFFLLFCFQIKGPTYGYL